MDFSKLLHGFVKIDIWISLSCYMNLSKLIHIFTWICQICFMYFWPFAKQKQAEVGPRFQSLLKLLLWTEGIEWVKVLNALGPLCLWQCFVLYIQHTHWSNLQLYYIMSLYEQDLLLEYDQWLSELLHFSSVWYGAIKLIFDYMQTLAGATTMINTI